MHNIPTLKTWVGFARIWTIINLPGLLSHNIDITSFIEGILSIFDYSKFRGLSLCYRFKPLAEIRISPTVSVSDGRRLTGLHRSTYDNGKEKSLIIPRVAVEKG